MSNLREPKTPRLRYVKSYTDRHGVTRHYYRRRGFPEVPLRGKPGTKEFLASYDRALAECTRVRVPSGFLYAIRVRGFDLVKVGYSTDPEPGDIYLDDGAHYALAAKFALDWRGQTVDWTYSEEWALMETQKLRDAEEELHKWLAEQAITPVRSPTDTPPQLPPVPRS